MKHNQNNKTDADENFPDRIAGQSKMSVRHRSEHVFLFVFRNCFGCFSVKMFQHNSRKTDIAAVVPCSQLETSIVFQSFAKLKPYGLFSAEQN